MSAHTLDCRGMACPLPIVKMSLLAKELEPGDEIEVIATDNGFPSDVQGWCRSTGNEFLGVESAEHEHRGRVRISAK